MTAPHEKPLSYFFLRPQYWPGLILVGCAWLIGQMPFFIHLRLAKFLSYILLKFSKKRRTAAEINLELCFPEKSAKEKQELLKESFLMTALGIMETLATWFTDLKQQKKNTTIIGLEHLKEAQAKGKGVILLSFHFTSMEIGGCLLSQYIDYYAMYKPIKKNALAEYVMRNGRLRHMYGMLTQDDAKGTLKKLKENQIVWYATDQNYGNKKGIFVPFFGTQASTVTAISKFAKMTGASVVPFTHKRTKDLKSLELTLHPAFENFPSDSPEQDAIRINCFLEDFLKENPANYLWLHQRFRSRPEGEPPIYPKRKKK